ncbi:MAG: hypothetical protein IIV77_00035 [Bacteroidaceae bacterium]|nr:hypothetical protein [Bacteroidaceae bacterium]
MAKTRETMIPGKRYRGYGFVNEFKEFCFEPENTGSREGVIKAICTRDGIGVSETREHLLIRIKMRKCPNLLERIKELSKVYNQLLKIFREYEI